MPFKYALFDFDMTLIDSIAPLQTSANLLARRFGLREVTYEEVYRAEVSGPNVTFESLWTELWGHYDPRWYEVYRDHLTGEEYAAMALYPTGRETLETLHAQRVPLGLASNRDYPRRALQSLGIEHLFQVVLGQFDVEKPKPDPEMILKALDFWQAPKDEALYICDSRGDLAAAQAAGIRAFALTTGGHSAEKLLELGAWKAGDRLVELLALFH